jgi:hypothetical protein
MPRPARARTVVRTYARQRHRTWMLSMTLASLGWACWWSYLVFEHFAPHVDQAFWIASALGSGFAAFGLVAGLLCLRAKRAWVLLASVALIANASLLALPWIARALMASHA